MAKGDLNSVQSNAAAGITRAQTNANRIAQTTEPGYGEFAKTGGVSPQEEANARKETSYGIGSMYGALKQNLARRQNVQGGYAPGLGANEAKLGRAQAEQTSQGINQTNLGLLQQKRQGQLAGLGGLSALQMQNESLAPQYLGIKGQAAANQKNWWQNMSDIESAFQPIAAGISGGMSGGMGGGMSGFANA